MKTRCLYLVTSILGGCGVGTMLVPAALAQTAATAAGAIAPVPTAAGATKKDPTVDTSAPRTPVVEDVTVTAEKRTSTAQKTAIPMEVYTASTLRANNITNLTDLAQISPTLNVATSGDNTIFTIRGVSSRDTTEIGDSSVSVSIDGFYLQRAVALDADTFDLERVEVLRGPQGTLYGRNSTAGAINLITAKPTATLGGFASFEYGDYNDLIANAEVNVPVTDRIQIRAAFMNAQHDGYDDNGAAGHGDDEDTKAGRISLRAEPTDRLTLLATGEFSHDGGVGPEIYGTPLQTDASGTIVHSNSQVFPDDRNWPLNNEAFQSIQTNFVRWRADYDLGFATASYLGGYRQMFFHHDYDIDGLAITKNEYDFVQNENERTMSHELRLASKSDQRLVWQLGGYYFLDKNDLRSFFFNRNTVPQTLLAGFLYPNVEDKSYAFFGQTGYKILPNLTVEGGVRYSDDYKVRTGNEETGSGALIDEGNDTEDNKVNWHAALKWQARPANLLYFTYDTGYKAGGFNETTSYNPETLDSYELGSKNRFFHDRLQLNGDLFLYDYKNQQVSEYIDPSVGTLTQNAGSSKVYGAELEGIYLIDVDTKLDFAFDYADAHYTDFIINQVTGQNLAGNRAIQAPRWTIQGGLEHEWHLRPGQLTARIQTRYQTESFFDEYDTPELRQTPYTKTDLLLNFRPRHSRWTISAYIKNLENALIIGDSGESTFYGSYYYQFEAPRTYGGSVSYRF